METALDTKVMKQSLKDIQEKYRERCDILEGYWSR